MKQSFTIWFNDEKPIPEVALPWIESQKRLLPNHRIITLESPEVQEALRSSHYFRECIGAKRWVKAADFFRVWFLFLEGGLYVDIDVEILVPYDKWFVGMEPRLFAGVEKNQMISNAVIGAPEPNHPLLEKYLQKVTENFVGSGDLVFEPGMGTWHNTLLSASQIQNGLHILRFSVFFPYDHQTGEVINGSDTVAYHHFLKSWKNVQDS